MYIISPHMHGYASACIRDMGNFVGLEILGVVGVVEIWGLDNWNKEVKGVRVI